MRLHYRTECLMYNVRFTLRVGCIQSDLIQHCAGSAGVRIYYYVNVKKKKKKKKEYANMYHTLGPPYSFYCRIYGNGSQYRFRPQYTFCYISRSCNCLFTWSPATKILRSSAFPILTSAGRPGYSCA